MSTAELKKELWKLIDQQEDEALLEAALQVLSQDQSGGDWWEKTPEAVKAGIREGERDFEEGRIHSNEEAKKIIREKLGR